MISVRRVCDCSHTGQPVIVVLSAGLLLPAWLSQLTLMLIIESLNSLLNLTVYDQLAKTPALQHVAHSEKYTHYSQTYGYG